MGMMAIQPPEYQGKWLVQIAGPASEGDGPEVARDRGTEGYVLLFGCREQAEEWIKVNENNYYYHEWGQYHGWPSNTRGLRALRDQGRKLYREDDVFFSMRKIRPPRMGVIMGAGPAGRGGHRYIPARAYTIALNSVYKTVDYNFRAVMVYDKNAPGDHYWRGLKKFKGKIILGEEIASYDIKPDYTFRYIPPYRGQNKFLFGVLHGGMSIAGAALLYLYWLGRAHGVMFPIRLLGVDMYGNLHHDGEINGSYLGEWPVVHRLAKACRVMSSEGWDVKVSSSSSLMDYGVEYGSI